jgi:hypothetical protein
LTPQCVSLYHYTYVATWTRNFLSYEGNRLGQEKPGEGETQMNEMKNPPGRSRPQKPRRLKPRAAFRQAGVLVLLVAASMAFGCGSGGGDDPPPPEESDIWDEMSWDEGSWALYLVSPVDTLG